MSIYDSFSAIRDEVAACALSAGRKEDSVQLMAVSKFHSQEEIEEAIKAGAILFGENRVQEAAEKFPHLLDKFPQIQLHQIGSLQRNKVKTILPLVTCVQSVDRMELINEMEKIADNLGRHVEILLECHTAEDSKSGFANYDEVFAALERLKTCDCLSPVGFMTMAPFCDDEREIRASFKQLRGIADKAKSDFREFDFSVLSMGMSGDYKIAIEEGSTLVRIGTAIFGPR